MRDEINKLSGLDHIGHKKPVKAVVKTHEVSTESLPPVTVTNHHDLASNLGSSFAELHEVLLKSKPQPILVNDPKQSLTPEKNILINRLAYRLLNKRNATDQSGKRAETQSIQS